jgi:hypothetical protein
MLKRIKYKKMKNSSGRRACDELWSLFVRTRDGFKCSICDNTKMPNAHHLITRKVFKYRYDVDNGLTLCPDHHEFSVTCSAHTAPWGVEKWMGENRKEQFKRHVEARNNITNVKTDYQKIYLRLEEEYKELTGNYHKISRVSQYIMFLNADKINDLYNDGKSVKEIFEEYKEYGISLNALKLFMKNNKISL